MRLNRKKSFSEKWTKQQTVTRNLLEVENAFNGSKSFHIRLSIECNMLHSVRFVKYVLIFYLTQKAASNVHGIHYNGSAIHRIQYESNGGMEARTNGPLLMIWPFNIQWRAKQIFLLKVRMGARDEKKIKKRIKKEKWLAHALRSKSWESERARETFDLIHSSIVNCMRRIWTESINSCSVYFYWFKTSMQLSKLFFSLTPCLECGNSKTVTHVSILYSHI